MHSLKIVHRDIKPGNIMMSDYTENAEVYIGDLGSAFKMHSSSDTRSLQIGTKGFIAPEMLKHRPYSFPIDVWALGTLMYLLMSLKMPFYHENDKKSRKLTLEQPVDLKNKNVC